MADSEPETKPRRSGHTRSPAKRSAQYRESRAHVAAKREDWEHGQEVKRQRTEATDPPQAPPKTKARLSVAVKMPSPQVVRTKAPSSNKSNEKGKAPPATKGGHAMSPIDEIELLPIHPGPRPLSDNELELELLTDEWKNILANTDYDDLKFILGADSGWSSEDEQMDHKVAPRCHPKPKPTAPPPKTTISAPKTTDSTYSAPKPTASGHKTTSAPKTTTSAPKATMSGSKATMSAPGGDTQMGQFDEEPPCRKPVPLFAST
ncbi:hypothetical protein FRC11_000916 [Ceratobasidium sp. 423]|nr:hypothetical protein FRC11_000916 [Ceratobasidium sp. 423]